MKLILAMLFLPFTSFGNTITQFDCVTTDAASVMEVHFQENMLSYDDGRFVDIAITSSTQNENMLKVSGLAKNLVFTGGGSQAVSVKIDTKTKKGHISIYTRTFYRNSEVKKDLNCTF